jgi:UDP-2-acetamido-2,6-beta-L-arabino-hexul-4-ose reductase
MKKVGITGQSGFIGTHLCNTINLYNDKYSIVNFDKSFFEDEKLMDEFVSNCDIIVHLSGVNRSTDQEKLYRENIFLSESLINSLERTKSKPHIIYSSSTQEEKDNLYGSAKKYSRERIDTWAKKNNARFTGLIIPNVFGPFGKPFYNSVIATFCYQLTHDETPRIEVDAVLNLIYVGDLVANILTVIDTGISKTFYFVEPKIQIRVSELLEQLISYKDSYSNKGFIPILNTVFDIQLFNTFRSFESINEKYPVKYVSHTDYRGNFTELIKLNNGGQVSFSTTKPGITRGNHFHTRKIERFSVIKGEAVIQLRRIGTDKIFNFKLSGEHPSYVDMPVWYTHNITNIGNSELYTVFWINEFFNSNDPDTFMEIV